jgi:hypothetical protein
MSSRTPLFLLFQKFPKMPYLPGTQVFLTASHRTGLLFQTNRIPERRMRTSVLSSVVIAISYRFIIFVLKGIGTIDLLWVGLFVPGKHNRLHIHIHIMSIILTMVGDLGILCLGHGNRG